MENVFEKKIFLNPGDIVVTKESCILETVLGSCISICIWDSKNSVAGMNHFVFSEEYKNKETEKTGKYGKISTCYMIKSMMEMGANIKNMRAVIAGGAKNTHLGPEVGIENRKLAIRVLEHYGIEILKEETGGERGRKVTFNSKTGEININYINER